jgi:hypothetical protein
MNFLIYFQYYLKSMKEHNLRFYTTVHLKHRVDYYIKYFVSENLPSRYYHISSLSKVLPFLTREKVMWVA